MQPPATQRITLADLQACRREGRKFAMLTAYDYPTAAIAQASGVPALLIGDTMGSVLLGHPNTQQTPLALMLMLGEAVRRGAPNCFLSGDLPFEATSRGREAVVEAGRRFRDEAGCDAAKVELQAENVDWIEGLAQAGVAPIAHLGLLPQQVVTPDGYRPQARDRDGIAALVETAKRVVEAGAVIVLLEAVPPEASAAVVAAIEAPVIGCGAGPACDGHVVVTHDMLGLGMIRPPRFVPVNARIGEEMAAAMRQYVEDITSGRYPEPKHAYSLRRDASKPISCP